jgi:rubrerythrin
VSYETTKDVLDRAREFHRQVSAFYEQLGSLAAKERVKIVLDYMSRHQKYLDACLAEYERNASREVLETWFQYTAPIETRRCIASIALAPEMSVSDVIKAAVRLANCLAELYRAMAEEAVSDEVKDLFKELLHFEKTEEHNLVRDLVEMEDL